MTNPDSLQRTSDLVQQPIEPTALSPDHKRAFGVAAQLLEQYTGPLSTIDQHEGTEVEADTRTDREVENNFDSFMTQVAIMCGTTEHNRVRDEYVLRLARNTRGVDRAGTMKSILKDFSHLLTSQHDEAASRAAPLSVE